MNWHNPDEMPWSEFERTLSGRAPNIPMGTPPTEENPDGDSAPGYSHKRPAYTPPDTRPDHPDEPYVPYAELHCHSDFSFLDGASDPEALIEEAVRLRLAAGDGPRGRAADAPARPRPRESRPR